MNSITLRHAVLVDHQAGIEETDERRALGGHAGEGRLDDLAQHALHPPPGVTTGAGEYAPMPPVFGPRSPSSRRL